MTVTDQERNNKRTLIIFCFFIGVIFLSVSLIVFLATGSWKHFFYPETEEILKPRIITVREANSIFVAGQTELIAREDNLITKIPLEEGEIVIAVLNIESERGFAENQFVVYRTADADNPVYITFISYDRSYRRMWDAPTAATRPQTITLFSQDLIGDRNNCIIVTGMNARNEHTMTIFRRTQPSSYEYNKIAEIQIEGSIVIQETSRSLAYQQGIASGQSFNIAAYGRDISSSNILDQIETIYSFNPLSGRYEQVRVSRIPGSQVEQRRLRELLSGAPGVFENFINGLWYYVSPQGTVDTRRYMYFDPARREVIFFGDDAQQVFLWQNSTPTRLGLFIRSRNISINTLLRFIDIELGSLDSLRIRVNEDVRLRITANTTWDGTYRRAGAASQREAVSQLMPAFDAVYDSIWGRIQFYNNGEYTITSGDAAGRNLQNNIITGRYVFYSVDNNNLIELRTSEGSAENRMVYKMEHAAGVLILSRVRVGTSGIQDLLEPPVTLTPVN
jgi:hypothetical protein